MTDTLKVRGRKYQLVPSPTPGRCGPCAFKAGFGCALAEETGNALIYCSGHHRADGLDMVWVPVCG